MNHIQVRCLDTGVAAAPQGVDRYYPYADTLSVAEGEALFTQNLARYPAETLGKLLESMPGKNQLRASSSPTTNPTNALGYIGLNGNGSTGGSLSIYVYGVQADACQVSVTATGSTPAYSFSKAMDYKPAGWPREGLIPASSLPPFAALTADIPYGTYQVSVTTAAGKTVLLKSVTTTGAALELIVRSSDTGQTTPPTTNPTPTPAPTSGNSDPVAYDRQSGTAATPEPGTDANGQPFNTSAAPLL